MRPEAIFKLLAKKNSEKPKLDISITQYMIFMVGKFDELVK